MKFVHDDRDFADLLRIVARERRLSVALVEKDYWVTHSLWALLETGLDVWFKGGTSLSKGFGLIHRFSEDLDLQIEPGRVSRLPETTSWKSTSAGAIASRRAFFEALTGVIRVPDAPVELDTESLGKNTHGAAYRVHYPGRFRGELHPSLHPFVLLEIGRALVEPFEERALSSFGHDRLETRGQLGEYRENRPANVRCVHPLVTLIEKIDAIARRFSRGEEPAPFIRHYEDAARIIDSEERLPALRGSLVDLIESMLQAKRIRRLPAPDDPAFTLVHPDRRAELERAHRAIDPMFWGQRLSLVDAAETIREWLSRHGG